MNRAVDKKAESIIKLFPKIISLLGKLHQDRFTGEIADKPDVNFNGLISKNGSAAAITLNQYLTLIIIQALKACSVNELAAELKIAQSTASQLVDRLVKAGFVKREPNSGDRRRMTISLSVEGSDVLNEKKNVLKQSFAKILSLLDSNEQHLFEEAFTVLYALSEKLDSKLRNNGRAYSRHFPSSVF